MQYKKFAKKKSTILIYLYMSHIMRKPAFRICEDKDADQLRGNTAAHQRLYFHIKDRTISLLLKYKISCLLPSSMFVQVSLCRTWSEPLKTVFSCDTDNIV